MFSPTVLQHFHPPARSGPLPEANAIGQTGMPGEGPHLVLYLRIEENCIRAASFETYPCPVAVASASFVVQWVEGKTTEEVKVLEAGDLMQVLGGVPLGKEHCAVRAIETLRQALANYEAEGAGSDTRNVS